VNLGESYVALDRPPLIIVSITGESFRLKGKRKAGVLAAPGKEQRRNL
jgi:hypothetical protein